MDQELSKKMEKKTDCAGENYKDKLQEEEKEKKVKKASCLPKYF